MIPVIDVSDAFQGERLDDIARAVTDACSEIGFFQLVGMPIDKRLFDAAYQAYASFFAHSETFKAAYVLPHSRFHGYESYTRGAGAQEAFQFGAIETRKQAASLGISEDYGSELDDIVWPDVANFREPVRALFAAERRVATVLMCLFARGLGLPADYFETPYAIDGSNFAGRSYYNVPGLPAEDAAHEVLFNEHTDTGGVTFVNQRGNYDGLKVRLRSGELIAVPVREDALVCNVGDLLMRWTNGRLRSTPHLVSMPGPGQFRQSVILFHQPAVSAEIKPVPELIGAEGALYAPATAYELLRARSYRETGAATA